MPDQVSQVPGQRAALIADLLTLAIFCGFLFFYGLGSFGLVGADEPRYAQIAREMLARHDWVTPVLNGTAWLEKPVLYYWGAILSYKLFGVSDWAARVPSAAMATLLVFSVYLFLRQIPSRIATGRRPHRGVIGSYDWFRAGCLHRHATDGDVRDRASGVVCLAGD